MLVVLLVGAAGWVLLLGGGDESESKRPPDRIAGGVKGVPKGAIPITPQEAARQFDIENFVFASTSSVYGQTDKVPFVETDPTDQMESTLETVPPKPFAASRLAPGAVG